jgi:cyclophilin family peptidyl-prolyl cis-trans isomerase
MKNVFILLIIGMSFSAYSGTKVLMSTSMGDVEIELFDKKSPSSSKNFLMYIDKGFYNDTVFHRVIDNYIVQGGGYTKDLELKDTEPQIKNEALNMVPNLEGTIAMARRRPKHSATSQFYFNLKDNKDLNHLGLGAYGYAVFGKITKGLEVAKLIGKVKTERKGNHKRVPLEPVFIKSIKRITK